MNLHESSLSRLMRFFELTTCCFVSGEISMDTVRAMAANNREDFFKQLSQDLRRPDITLVNAQAIKEADLQAYNRLATARLKKLPMPYVRVRGAFSYDGKTFAMENTCVFIGLTNEKARSIASQFYQKAYIFCNKGNFFYFDSEDYQSYSVTGTALTQNGKIPIQVKSKHTHHDPRVAKANPQDKRSNDPRNVFKLGPDSEAMAGTIQGNKSFLIHFDWGQSAETQVTAESYLPEFVDDPMPIHNPENEDPSIFVPGVGKRTLEQAQSELTMWVQAVQHSADSGEYGQARAQMKAAEEYLLALINQASA